MDIHVEKLYKILFTSTRNIERREQASFVFHRQPTTLSLSKNLFDVLISVR